MKRTLQYLVLTAIMTSFSVMPAVHADSFHTPHDGDRLHPGIANPMSLLISVTDSIRTVVLAPSAVSSDGSGNPARISYADGGYTEYVYSASEEKLRMTHSSVLDATAAGTDLYGVLDSAGDMDGGLNARSITEYHGDVIYRDGKVWMVLFPEVMSRFKAARLYFTN